MQLSEFINKYKIASNELIVAGLSPDVSFVINGTLFDSSALIPLVMLEKEVKSIQQGVKVSGTHKKLVLRIDIYF